MYFLGAGIDCATILIKRLEKDFFGIQLRTLLSSIFEI